MTRPASIAEAEQEAQLAHLAWLDANELEVDANLCPDSHEDYFPSGSNLPGEIEGLALCAENVGCAANRVTPASERALGELAGLTTKVFVDSGAFSELKDGKQPRWSKVLALYARLARVLGQQLYVVAPDKIGDQAQTFERLSRFAAELRELRLDRANVIVAIQRGSIPMAQFYARCCELLGFRPIAGIPLNKCPVPPAELRAFVDAARPRAVHFLGRGPESPIFEDVWQAVREGSPLTRIYSDSVAIKRLSGRTNGRSHGPRAITAAQDAVRLEQPGCSSQVVKRESARRVFHAAAQARIDEDKAAGWFDAELYSSWEEANGETDAVVHRNAAA